MLRRGGRQHADQNLRRMSTLLARPTHARSRSMEVVHERCCGLDIHKMIVACSIVPGGGSGKPVKSVRTFGTMSDELQQLSGWLAEQGVTHVAMESTASYWKPIFNVLEERFELLQ